MALITAAQAAQGIKGTVAKGRAKGQLNKTTAAAREIVAAVVDRNSHHLDRWLEEIYEKEGAKGAFAAYIAILDYHVPKLQRVEHTGKDEGPQEIIIKWGGKA